MTFPPTINVARCGNCGLWKFTNKPCPACDRAADVFLTHEWIEPTPGEIPQCDWCGTKVIHEAAWQRCDETFGSLWDD